MSKVQADNHRETIKASILAKAKGILAEFGNIEEVLVDEPEINYKSRRMYDDDGLCVIMSKISCDGLTVEQLVPKFDNQGQLAGTVPPQD